MKNELFCTRIRKIAARILLISVSPLILQSINAQTTFSTVPVNGATGVTPTNAVVFNFSAAMNTDATTVQFLDSTPTFYTPTTAWSAGNTVLTCTPVTPFASNKEIFWSLSGEDASANPVDGSGFFTTGAGGGSTGGSGTNKITSFVVGKLYSFDQASTGAPTPDTNNPLHLQRYYASRLEPNRNEHYADPAGQRRSIKSGRESFRTRTLLSGRFQHEPDYLREHLPGGQLSFQCASRAIQSDCDGDASTR